MSCSLLVNVALLVALSPSPNCPVSNDNCLPTGIQPTDVVSTQVASRGTHGKVVTVTVADKLRELKARCRKRKLVDARGREIRFYQLVGCWGNPPDDYQQQLERQAKELVKLRKRYRVIEMTCNPSGEDKMRSAPPVPNPGY